MNKDTAKKILAVCFVAALLSGCARSWPDELPAPTEWQVRSAPLMDHPNQTDLERAVRTDRVFYAAYVYASDWADRPVDDWQFELLLPSRLDVLCRDVDNDLDGVVNIMMIPSQIILRRWHPANWSSAVMVFTEGERSSDPIVMQVSQLSGGVAPFVEGSDNITLAVNGFRAYATLEDASVTIRATFKDEDRPPLTFSFPLDPSAKSDNLRLMLERCGVVW